MRPSPRLARAGLCLLLPTLAACGGGGGDGTTDTASSTSTDTSTSPGTSTSTGTTADTPTGSATGEPTGTTAADPTTTSPTTGGPGTTGTSDTDTSTTGGVEGCAPALPTFADGKSPDKTLHVQAGAPAGGDGTQAKPFAELGPALAAATPGTEVRVSGELSTGAYTTGLQGTADAPIWIRGEPGAKVGPLTLEGASHIVVEDLELSNSPMGHVLHFFFADHLLLRRLKIHDAGLGCIKGSQTTFVYVEDSELWSAGNSSQHPVLDYVGVNNGHIVGSDFHDGPGVMIMLKGGTSDLLFAWNRIHAQTAPGNALSLGQTTGPQYFYPLDSAFEGLRIVAFANLLYDLVGAPVAFEGCKDCAALHNTIWDATGGQLVRFLPGAAGQDSGVMTSISEGCRFAGNIVVGGQEGGASLNADQANVGPGNVIDYNVFLKPGALNWWGVIPQDMTHSTYDQDPQVGPDGVPANVPLVDGKGPPDLAGLPFAEVYGRDYTGACMHEPRDIGAIAVP